MSLLQIAKQINLVRDLAERLSLRLPGYSLVQSTDSSGAILSVSQHSPAVAGENNMIIRLVPFDSPNLDVIGNAQAVYSPSKAQCVEEASSVAGQSVLDLGTKAKIDWEIARMGCYEERYLRANAAVPTTADILAANLKASIGDYKWNSNGGQ